jgi:hypothetical protein
MASDIRNIQSQANTQRLQLQNQIWKIANEVRGAVDGWDFRQFVLGTLLVLTSDKTFSSPSTAADFCIGSSNNGWLVWKDKDGNTLDSVYRKQLE